MQEAQFVVLYSSPKGQVTHAMAPAMQQDEAVRIKIEECAAAMQQHCLAAVAAGHQVVPRLHALTSSYSKALVDLTPASYGNNTGLNAGRLAVKVLKAHYARAAAGEALLVQTHDSARFVHTMLMHKPWTFVLCMP